jgi:hypothetical protein
MRDRVYPQNMGKIIDAYASAVDNQNQHVHPDWPYPTAERLRGIICKAAEVCFTAVPRRFEKGVRYCGIAKSG